MQLSRAKVPGLAPGKHKVYEDLSITCSCLLPSPECSQRAWKILDLFGVRDEPRAHTSKKHLQLI